ncbi:MAG: hypothetical protein AB7U05_15580 [Mangrovibacterium sp.]
MQNYLTQLIADIRRATWNLNPPHELWLDSEADPDNELELEDMSFIEQYIEGEELPIAEITGMEQEQLPAPEQLNEQQQALLAEELEKLLDVFHFKLDFQESFPANLRYPFIRNFWAESHVPLSFGENHIEFCDYEEEHCPFPGYCNTCKEVDAQMKFDEQTGALATDWDFEVDDLLISPAELEERMREQHSFLEDEAEIDRIAGQRDPSASGFFDDDGNPVNPELIPVPGLCIICKRYQEEDWNENMFCQHNRYNQRNNPDFKCGAFEKQ